MERKCQSRYATYAFITTLMSFPPNYSKVHPKLKAFFLPDYSTNTFRPQFRLPISICSQIQFPLYSRSPLIWINWDRETSGYDMIYLLTATGLSPGGSTH